jgi:predicted dehydrogenase
MQQSEYCDVTAIASRNEDKAKAVAKQLGLPKAYGSYEKLLADTDIDAVYIPLPNHLHIPWTVKALESGKHVLCEKPIGLTVAEAQGLLDKARKHPQLKVMEAFMYRLHPQWRRTQQLVAGGAIGTLKTIQSFFSYYNVDPGDIRNITDIGGGGLLDIGCYCVSLARLIFGEEPQRVWGVMEYDPKFKTDRLASGILDFGEGLSTFTSATQLASYQRVNIFGTEGRIEIEIPFNAPTDKPSRIWHQRGAEMEEIIFDVCNQYTIQGDLFSLAVLNDTEVPTPLEDAVANMKVLEAVFQSDRDETWITL